MRREIILIGFVLLCSSFVNGLTGEGTEEKPYLIQSLADFDEFAGNSSYWAAGVYTHLETDIDLSGRTYSTAVIAPGRESFTFFQGIPFEGVFEGAGHKVINLKISTSDPDNDFLSLFGCIELNGEVKNLGVENCYIIGQDENYDLGGLCGLNNGTIINCYTSGSVSGYTYQGGLCGWNNGTIMDCYSTVSNTFYSWCCGKTYVGGLCGRNSIGGTIGRCYATGYINDLDNGEDDYIGGLCGRSSGIVYHSFWDVQTSGTTSSAGGIGLTTAEMINKNTYIGWGDNVWTISDANDYAHLVWEGKPGEIIVNDIRTYSGGDGTAENPYLIAEPNDIFTLGIYSDDWDEHFKLTNDIDMSAFTFYEYLLPIFSSVFDGDGYTISNLIIDTQSDLNTGNNNGCYIGLFGKIFGATAEVKNLNLEDVSITGGYISKCLGCLCGWNYGGTIINCSSAGIVTAGNDSESLGCLCGWNYEGMIYNCYAEGTVAGSDNSDRLGGLCGSNNYGVIIDCYSTGLITGGINSNELGGLCGDSSSDCVISNCHSSAQVEGGENSIDIGGLCGEIWGSEVKGCSATGTVIGGGQSENLGGLCGASHYGTISESYSISPVSGGDLSQQIGGLCGLNRGTVTNCYATGSVSGYRYLGGLFGKNDNGIITNCYAKGSVTGVITSYGIGGLCGYSSEGIISDCYFLDTSGPDNGLGVPLTDVQMKIQSSFANWDFVGEYVNGTEDIWRMCVDGVYYPKVWWQYSTHGDFACPDGVGVEDLSMLADYWLETGIEPLEVPDATGDGQVDLEDFAITSKHWMEGI